MQSKTLHLTLFLLVLGISLFIASEKQSICEGARLTDLEKNNDMFECAILIDNDLDFPRNIAVHEGDIWLIDKGSDLFENNKNNGAIYHYKNQHNVYQRRLVLDGLEDPNDIDIRHHNDGSTWLYYTTRHTVERFDLSLTDIQPEAVIRDIPTYGWHKLASIKVSQASLFLSVPSSTDHCELAYSVSYPCHEEDHGTAQIRQYDFNADSLSEDFKVIAKGLRNASAVELSADKSKLIVADNGWDQINLNNTEFEYSSTPHDEINIIDLAKNTHFGWPYCFDNSLVTPPYRQLELSCNTYQAAHILLPAHSAPLNMTYFGELLLLNLHGNNDSAARTIAFSLNKQGLPIEPFQTTVNWNTGGPTLGRPMGLAKLSDKTLLVTDDWNHQLLKLVFKAK